MDLKDIVIIGAGNSGLTMAAHLTMEGHDVRLFSRRREEVEKLSQVNTIMSQGVIVGAAPIKLFTNDISQAVEGAELIIVATPADAHCVVAELLAPHLTDRKIICLHPGRTFGAIEFLHSLRRSGAPEQPLVGETQTTIYTCRKCGLNIVEILALKKSVQVAGLNATDTQELLEALPSCLSAHLEAADNIGVTSLGNIGPILHTAPMLFNAGWVECGRTSFKYYRDGITPLIASFLERIDAERVALGEKLGIGLVGVTEWMKKSYDIRGDTLYETIQNNSYYGTIEAPVSLRHRYLMEDISTGLVPYEALGAALGLKMKLTAQVIDLATELLEYDFRSQGRNFRRLGWESSSIDTIASVLKGAPSVQKDNPIQGGGNAGVN